VIGSPVTLTLPTGVFLTDSSAVTVNAFPQVVQSMDLAAGVIVFRAPPNAHHPVVVSNLGVTSNPNLAFTLATGDSIRTDSITIVPSTVNTTTPAAGAPVTLTVTDPRFTFDASSQVALGLDTAITQSIAADGSSITFVPLPGAIGVPTAARVFIGGYALDIPATVDTVTVDSVGVPPIAGTGSPATAPTIELIPGVTRGVVDAVTGGYAGCADVPEIGAPCQIYKVVLPADGSLRLNATWEGLGDVGIYMLAGDGTTFTGNFNCDLHGSGDGNKPETCVQPLLAGTYFVAVVPWEAAQWVSLRVTAPVPVAP
jgi:hypothetical protein